MAAGPVTVTYETRKIAEAHGDNKIIFTPHTGPNAFVDVEIRTTSEISYSLNVAGDHVMGSAIGPRAVAHTEAKPGGSLGANAREIRRIIADHCGGALVPGDMQDVISRPGLSTDVILFEGVIWTGDIGGMESSSGSIPTSSADFLCVDVKVNGKSLLSDGRDGISALLGAVL